MRPGKKATGQPNRTRSIASSELAARSAMDSDPGAAYIGGQLITLGENAFSVFRPARSYNPVRAPHLANFGQSSQ